MRIKAAILGLAHAAGVPHEADGRDEQQSEIASEMHLGLLYEKTQKM
jgi:hypothetical protein